MKKSFTLIELIVVIAIIAVLAAIIAPNAFKAIEKAKISECIADLKNFKTAVMSYWVDVGEWPWAPQSLGWVDVGNSFLTLGYQFPVCVGWDGPYLDKPKKAHPWGGKYSWPRTNILGDGIPYEFGIMVNSRCYPSGLGCPAPYSAALKIDQTLDDGNLNDGNLRGGIFGETCDEISGECGQIVWVIDWEN